MADYQKYQRHIIGKNTYSKTQGFYEDLPGQDHVGISDQYIILDSFMKQRDSNVEGGEFKWTFAIQGQTRDQMIGVTDKLNDIIELEISEFYLTIPEDIKYEVAETLPTPTPNIDKLTLLSPRVDFTPPLLGDELYPNAEAITPWVHNPYSQMPFSGRFTIQIREFGRQAYSDINGAYHHFEFITSYPRSYKAAPNMLLAEPITKKFIFTEPIRNVESMTLVFRDPDNIIKFANDVIYDAQVQSVDITTSPGYPPNGRYVRIYAPKHGLLPGDRIFISGSKTTSPSLNKHINRNEGHVVTADLESDSADYFMLDPLINLQDLPADKVISSYVTINIAKRRIRIPIRARRVLSYLTNHITI
jgi:hypothetical protein